MEKLKDGRRPGPEGPVRLVGSSAVIPRGGERRGGSL